MLKANTLYNSTAMEFRNTDMNMKSDSIPFSHWKSNTHDWNLEPKCLSSSSLSYRTPKRTAFFQNNGDCESYITLRGKYNGITFKQL
jgi:hypothetical protein